MNFTLIDYTAFGLWILISIFISYIIIDKLKFFKGDISVKQNVYNWVNHNDLDGIIHFAAIVPTKNVLKDKKKSYQVNYMGTKYLIDALKKKYKKKFTKEI